MRQTLLAQDFTHPFETVKINQTVKLCDDAATVTSGGNSVLGKVVLKQQFLPNPSILVECKHEPLEIEVVDERPSVSVQLFGSTCASRINAYPHFLRESTRATRGFLRDSISRTISAAKITEVRFVIFNGPELAGATVSEGGSGFQVDGLIAETADARIEICGARRGSRLRAKARERAGFVVTHIGRVCFAEEGGFEPSQAEAFSEDLIWFLSFAFGNWCGPIMPVGYASDGSQVWEYYSSVKARSPASRRNWVATFAPDAAFMGFPAFRQAMSDGDDREWMSFAIGVYIEANNETSPELAITKVQIVVELLCWIMLVERGPRISEDGFRTLSAADKLRMALSMIEASTALPVRLKGLLKLAKAENLVDGPTAMTWVRNAIVHPTKKNRAKVKRVNDETRSEVRTLGLWYVELLLLHIFGYSGAYDNRCGRERPNTVFDLVPWSRFAET